MVDIDLLKKVIDESGVPISTVCRRAGIKRETFYNKLENPRSIKVYEIENISRALNLNQADRNRIFFAKDVE